MSESVSLWNSRWVFPRVVYQHVGEAAFPFDCLHDRVPVRGRRHIRGDENNMSARLFR